MTAILDAAALLCVLLQEEGADAVMPVLRGGIMSAVNPSEGYARGMERGATMDQVARIIRRFGSEDAREAALLRPPTKPAGCSLGDRACLALGRRLEAPIYTADRRTGSVRDFVGLDIRLVR